MEKISGVLPTDAGEVAKRVAVLLCPPCTLREQRANYQYPASGNQRRYKACDGKRVINRDYQDRAQSVSASRWQLSATRLVSCRKGIR